MKLRIFADAECAKAQLDPQILIEMDWVGLFTLLEPC